MAAVATRNRTLPITDTTQATQIVRGTIALSGNYGSGSSNGDTLNLSIYPNQSHKVPLRVLIYESPAAGTAPTGYSFQYGTGTTASNGVLIVSASGAASGLTATSVINAPAGAVTNALGVAASALTSTSGATNVTGVTTTIAGSGGAAGQITQGSAYPSALVTAATAGYLYFEAVFPLGQ